MADRGARILIVDDNDAQRYSLQRPLVLAGHTCFEVSTGKEALARVPELRPDLIVLDVRLPDISGFDVCRELKADPRTASILVLHVSAAETAPEAKAYGLQTGADAYLITPIHPRELVATVAALLRLRAAETARDQTLREFLEVIEAFTGGYLAFDAEGRLTYVNHEVERLAGRTRKDLIGQPIWDVMPPDLVPVLRGHVEEAVRTGKEVRFQSFDASRDRWFDARLVPTGRGFSLFSHDITDQLRTQAELADNEQRLRLATETTGIGTWDFNLRTGKIVWDARMRELLGVTADDAVDEDIFLNLLHPDDASRVQLRVRAAMADPLHPDFDVEHRVIGPHDRLERWVAVRGRVLHDADGRPNRMVGIAVDSGPTKVREREMRRVADYAEQLVAIVGHDLRSPLAAVQVSADLLGRMPGLDASALKHVRQIQTSVQRATRLTRQILDLTQARLGGGLRLEPAAHHLHETVRRAVDEIHAIHPGCEIRLALEASPDSGVWDDERIAQALINVLGNAVAHGNPGDPINVTTRGDDRALELVVHNGGAPIPPDVLPALFEPFHAGREGRPEGNLGLGLYIVDQILRAHGGTVAVQSGPGEGTTLVMRLPRHGSAAPL